MRGMGLAGCELVRKLPPEPREEMSLAWRTTCFADMQSDNGEDPPSAYPERFWKPREPECQNRSG